MTNLLADGCSLLPVFSEMQEAGMPVRRSHFTSLARRMTEEMGRIRTRISNEFYSGRPFNPKSPDDVSSLIRRRGLGPSEYTKRTKTGKMSTAEDSIGFLQYEDEAVELVFEWRERQHIRDSFCRPIIARLDPDGPEIQPLRCQLKPTRVATRRLAAADPNLLNMPSRTVLGREIRRGFVAPEGWVFGAWDFSQVEMRVAAHVSGDAVLTRLFKEGRDVHTETAAVLYAGGVLEAVTKEQRSAAKTANFGSLYGQGPEGMRAQLWKMGQTGWTLAACRKSLKDRAKMYEGLTAYERRVERELRRTGVVVDHWGMPRLLPGIWAKEGHVVKEAVRTAVNHTVQGEAQGMLQKAMLHLRPQIRSMQDEGKRIGWRLQVHDELVMLFDPELWEEVDAMMVDAMVNHCGVELSVPVEVDGKMAGNWAELK